jgi:hypothetical protein
MSSQAYDANNIFVNISFGAKYRLRRRLCRLTDIPERAANSANDAALKPNSPKPPTTTHASDRILAMMPVPPWALASSG